ncbi:hypothetical protein SAMN05444722_2150 [Rhodovulum sp. ES.010]|nr:hypothetical protein SAMN05444722_2150 [Rhodovulum sp. ES.010]
MRIDSIHGGLAPVRGGGGGRIPGTAFAKANSVAVLREASTTVRACLVSNDAPHCIAAPGGAPVHLSARPDHAERRSGGRRLACRCPRQPERSWRAITPRAGPSGWGPGEMKRTRVTVAAPPLAHAAALRRGKGHGRLDGRARPFGQRKPGAGRPGAGRVERVRLAAGTTGTARRGRPAPAASATCVRGTRNGRTLFSGWRPTARPWPDRARRPKRLAGRSGSRAAAFDVIFGIASETGSTKLEEAKTA